MTSTLHSNQMAASLDYHPAPNNYSSFINNQSFASVNKFVLESGVELNEVTVAYKTWGRLNAKRDNCLVICHALSGSSDVADWWGPLLGPGRAFDTSRYYIFCANVLGSPYGSTSSLSINPRTGRIYGPDFPQTTIRDDVRIHKLVLDALGVTSITVVGGSMGGMATLEWPLCTEKGYVKAIIPIATSADHNAWGISWAEAQRQCIFADPAFEDGHYLPHPATQPAVGLSAARMVAMLTYRSCESFDTRFGRKSATAGSKTTPRDIPTASIGGTAEIVFPYTAAELYPNGLNRRIKYQINSHSKTDPLFSAQSYLHYQGQKFIGRFDANCYIHLTRKMDKHDVTRGRIGDFIDVTTTETETSAILSKVFRNVPHGTLVIGVESDMLFRPEQQDMLAKTLPGANLAMLASPEGHDGFLLEFGVLGPLIVKNLKAQCPLVYENEALATQENEGVVIDSLVGEVESGW